MALEELDQLRSIEELVDYQGTVKARLSELHLEHAGLPFPEEVRDEFADLKDTEVEIEKRVKELRAREQYVRTLGEKEANVDIDVDAIFQRQERQARSEEAIFDLSNMRINPNDPDGARQAFRDRAMRAVELARFPAGISREACQDQVARLLDMHDTADGELAKRILRTGSPSYRKAFFKRLAGQPVSREEERAFSLATTGIPIPYTLDPTVIPVSASVVNPLRAISSVEQIVGSNEWRGVTAAAITAARAAEAAEATDNTPTLAQPTIVCSRVQAFVPFSAESAQDWASLEANMGRLFADAKDDEEATAFLSGNGTPPNPFGVLTGATGTTAAATGLTITAANLMSVEAALAPRFRPRAQWIANRAMYNIIRALDTAGGAQLWLRIGDGLRNAPASAGGQGNTGYSLLGYPANELSTMSATVVNATKIMVLGDFSMFKIIDRVGMSVQVIPHLFGGTANYPTGQSGLYAFWRNGSKVIDAVGFRALTGTT